MGREIETLVNAHKVPGQYTVTFNTSGRKSLASGIYFYKLQAGDFTDVKKMILVK
ncbi:MAG: T9SS type A sorting domain-containing protein [Ignavibacteria bacterium]